jgi:23S rRNA U2552 (ribose-2'-O)-methylase RlmE/FtsJ
MDNEENNSPKIKLISDVDSIYLDIVPKKDYPNNFESLGFDDKINSIKNKIENLNINDWNKIRKIVNPYDFPNIFNNNLKIFNRAFYKFWELLKEFDLVQEKNISLHLAEAPGSFICALLHTFKKKRAAIIDSDGFQKIVSKSATKIKVDTISLYSQNTPQFNHQIKQNSNVNFLLKDTDGDITNASVLKYFANSSKKYNLITADGGIDERGCYDSKEQIHLKLFLAQILIAFNTQEKDGDFVLKIYDIFTTPTVDLLWLLTQKYKEVFLYKPLTSRITNSEKYVVCKGYKGKTNNIDRFTAKALDYFYSSEYSDDIQVINFEIHPKPSQKFKQQFYEFNKNILFIQKESIEKALCLLEKPLSREFTEEQLENKKKKFLEWKKKFNLNLI